jgi:hypothetical protein
MYKKAVLLAVLAALAEQAQAFNAHRHLHDLNKRAMETEVVTVWQTVYYTPGQEAAAEPTNFVQNNQPAVEHEHKTKHKTKRPKKTSTTTSIVVSTTEVPPPPPPPQTTTMITVSKAPEPSPEPEPQPEPAPEPEPTPEPEPIEDPVEEPIIDISVPPVLNPVPATSSSAPVTTSAPKPPPSTGGGSVGFPSKRGMAYNDANLANVFDAACTSCSWAWNWGSDPSGLSDSINFVPTLWGPAELHSANWDQNAEAALSKGTKAMFSFNECDNAGQANLAADVAAGEHIKFMNKYSGKALIGAPSITNSGNPGEGVEWLEAFMSACDAQGGCAVDFCNVHWYSEVQYGETLFDHLEAAHQACGGRPIWLTEFAPFGSDEDISAFLVDALPRLDALEYLDAYSYFMVSAGSLMSSSSALSTYGMTYAST